MSSSRRSAVLTLPWANSITLGKVRTDTLACCIKAKISLRRLRLAVGKANNTSLMPNDTTKPDRSCGL